MVAPWFDNGYASCRVRTRAAAGRQANNNKVFRDLNIRAVMTGLGIVGLIAAAAYFLASSKPLNQELIYTALILALVICDRTFRPREPRE